MAELVESDLQRRLRMEMRKRGLTDAGLARAAKLGQTAVRDILEGRSREPRYTTIKKLADALGLAADRLTAPLDEFDYKESLESVSDLMQINVKEMDIRAAAGGGAMTEREDESGTWGFPSTWFRATFNAPANQVKVITIWGDSMEPDMCSGDKAIVDLSWTEPSPPGFFFLHDGLGLVAKQLEHVPQSDPPSIIIKSTNPRYDAYKRTAEEVRILGRIVAVIRRL